MTAVAARTSPRRRLDAVLERLRTADGRRDLACAMEAVLFRHVLDAHWPAVRDDSHGGFLTDLDRRWRADRPQDKSLEFIARETWVFARAAQAYPGRGYDEAARHGFAFLTEVMWDGAHGGFHTLVDRAGRPLRGGAKHPHGHTYAIEAGLAMVPLLGPGEGVAWAERTFEWLEAVAWDPDHGGYWGEYRADNAPVEADPDAPALNFDWIGTPIGWKDLNVPGDALGALTALAVATNAPRARARLAWYFDLYAGRLATAPWLMPYFYTRDWAPIPDLPRAGHPLQVVEGLYSAGRALGRAVEGLALADHVSKRALAFFSHPKGGVRFSCSPNPHLGFGVDPTVHDRVWWVQTEAARGCLLLALETGDPVHAATFARQWLFIERAMIDHDHLGVYESAEQGARARRHPDRPEAFGRKTSIWKDASHEAHLLMDAASWLREGAGTSGREPAGVQVASPTGIEPVSSP